MTQLNNVRMESIFYSLNELKHENLCLAKKLQERQMQRQTLEQDMEHAGMKCSQVQEKHRRMSETFAVAQQKVDESQTSVRNIEGKIGGNRPGVDCIQTAIKKEKTCQRDCLGEFESCLSSISTELFGARDFYKETALVNEIAMTQTMFQDLDVKKDQDNKTIQALAHRLNKLVVDENSNQSSDEIEGKLRAVICALERDKQEVYDYLQRLKAELQSVHDALKNAQASG